MNQIIKVLDESSNYWLVRTSGGEYYDQFVDQKFIAIGWNEISDLILIQEAKTSEEKKDLILKAIRRLVDNQYSRRDRPTGQREKEAQKSRIYNQIDRFVNQMAVGDYVLIPSQGSNFIEFGIIESEAYLVDRITVKIQDGECDFIKRRQVKWIHKEKRENLDPYLYQFIFSQHAISSANHYSSYIDRTINKLYIKGDQAHLVLGVGKTSDIYSTEIIDLIASSINSVDTFNEIMGTNLQKNLIQMRINVQSPGILELFGNITEIFAIAAVINAVVGGHVKVGPMEYSTPGLLGLMLQFIEKSQNYRLENKRLELQRIQQRLEIKYPPELDIQKDDDGK